jgi:hypothetical protein
MCRTAAAGPPNRVRLATTAARSHWQTHTTTRSPHRLSAVTPARRCRATASRTVLTSSRRASSTASMAPRPRSSAALRCRCHACAQRRVGRRAGQRPEGAVHPLLPAGYCTKLRHQRWSDGCKGSRCHGARCRARRGASLRRVAVHRLAGVVRKCRHPRVHGAHAAPRQVWPDKGRLQRCASLPPGPSSLMQPRLPRHVRTNMCIPDAACRTRGDQHVSLCC